MKENCPNCDGNGWVLGSKADHGCDGTDEVCNRICPVQVQIQIGCDYCGGSGLVVLPDEEMTLGSMDRF